MGTQDFILWLPRTEAVKGSFQVEAGTSVWDLEGK